MGKIDDYDHRGLPQETVDNLDDLNSIINNGKYQFTVVSTFPTWNGRRGETAIYIAGGSGSMLVATSDSSSADWSVVSTFST